MTFAYFKVDDCERISYIEEISILESLRDSVRFYNAVRF